MRFTILSHAGLAVSHQEKQLLIDPWIIGSTYWRSWWNYPPVQPGLAESLRPTHIYLTHIHWDHFQGASLKKFSRDTPVIVPKGPYNRMTRDLHSLGFHNVVELGHARSHRLGPDFTITSYQFGFFLDSAVVIECGGVVLLNANDAKLMGRPLRHVLRRHPKIDFVLRSHSSANSRLCYEVIDRPGQPVDDERAYIAGFAEFVRRTGARYAIPFASNHCYLHKDVYALNGTIKTPQNVREHFVREGIETPEVRIMTSGMSWSAESGFSGEVGDYFSNREAHLANYAAENAPKLEACYAAEERAVVTLGQIEKYFAKFTAAVPWLVRRMFRGHLITWVLHAGDRLTIFEVSLAGGTVRQLGSCDDVANPIQIHTSARIMVRCMAGNLFSHLSISKRVKYRVTQRNKRYVQILNLLFNLYEYDMLPPRRLFAPRFVLNWVTRWREVLLYARIAVDLARGRGLDVLRYI